MNIHFISFADKRFHKSLDRIKQQALASNYFDKVFAYTEDDIDIDFKKRFENLLTADTFYLCAWKPKVILQLLENMNEGDILLYADVGCHINEKAKKRFLEYLDIVRNSATGILASQFERDMPEAMWTKGDLFDYFECRDDKNITNSNQIQATTIFVEKRASTVTFMKDWLKHCTTDPELLDRSTCKSTNLDGYQEHRSDQSVFSILAKQAKIELIGANEVQGSSNWETEMIAFPIWAKRDRIIDDSFWIQPTAGRALLLIRRRMRKLFKKINN